MDTQSRNVIKLVEANPFTRGAGFTAYSVGQQSLGTQIAPFLQLDHYFMTQPTFPEHPHQGFSAVTYMFEDAEGSFFNRDSQGDRSTIAPGDLHWTQAGSGIRHEETPIEPGKVCHGMQMFIDLPIADKSLPAKAFHLSADRIPVHTTPTGARVRVVVGSGFGLTSPLQVSTQIDFLDVILPAGAEIEHQFAATESAFILAIKGDGTIDRTQSIAANQAALLPSDRTIRIAGGSTGLQYVVGIGRN